MEDFGPIGICLVANRRFPWSTAIWLTLGILLMGCSPGDSPPPAPPVASPVASAPPGEAVEGLRAELQVEKSEFALGEPIRVILKLHNLTSGSMIVWQHRERTYAYHAFTHFVVQQPGSPPITLGKPPGDSRNFPCEEIPAYETTTVEAGAIYEWCTALNSWYPLNGAFAFVPGVYILEAEYRSDAVEIPHPGQRLWRGRLLSNPVRITVTNKAAQADMDAPRWGEPAYGLRCGIATAKLAYALGERIPIRMTVEHVGTGDAGSARIEVPAFSEFMLVSRGGGRNANFAFGGENMAAVARKGVWIEPGHSISGTFSLADDIAQWKDPLPAVYEVWAETYAQRVNAEGTWDKPVRSQPIEILIVNQLP